MKNRNFIIWILQVLLHDQIKQDKTDGTCSTLREMTNEHEILVRKPEGEKTMMLILDLIIQIEQDC